MWLGKAQTWAMALELGSDALVELIVQQTHACYEGERGELHTWGFGCGHSLASELRKSGFERWSASRAHS